MCVKEKKRLVKLWCPCLTKVVELLAVEEEQKLDLGSIARAFGLEPATLKLNGHFISRGVDLVASSVTWNSLLSFFSSRGLSTGLEGDQPLVVDGKLTKSGSKRANDSTVSENCVPSTTEGGCDSINGRTKFGDFNSLKKKRLSTSDMEKNRVVSSSSLGQKRKDRIEDFVSPKRARMYEADLGSQKRETSLLPCSFTSVGMKRMREDEMAIVDSCKKIR